MIVIITYDGLNGASAQSCKTDRFTVWKVPCLSRQSIADQIVTAWYMYIHMRSSSGLFHVHIMLKASINSRQASVNLLRLVLGRNVEDAAVKL